MSGHSGDAAAAAAVNAGYIGLAHPANPEWFTTKCMQPHSCYQIRPRLFHHVQRRPQQQIHPHAAHFAALDCTDFLH